MFEASLLDMRSGARRRGCTTILSFTVQALGVGLLIIAPLLYTEALPHWRFGGPVLTPPRGEQPAAAEAPRRPQRPTTSEVVDGTVIAPLRIPAHAAIIREDAAPTPMGPSGAGVPGAPWGGSGPGSLLDSILKPPPVAVAPPPPRAVFRSSQFTEGMLIMKVKPVYPPTAIRAHIQGAVLLRALIGREGRIKEAEVLSGHPWLAAAAVDAVKQWRYRPYYLNGEAIEVETQVTVIFKLAGE